MAKNNGEANEVVWNAVAKTGDEQEIVIVDENTVRKKIYVVRGVQVMLDFDLANIYGYTTSAFNQQVRRNSERFPEDFRFRLTSDEMTILLSQNVTASHGRDRQREIWAFTEQGIYMLMTVLKGKMRQKNFNRQVKNNAAKFAGEEFMFRLTQEEWNEILRCKKFTSSHGDKRYLPFAFTEQGIYMLMTVLCGNLAIRQSQAIE